MKRIYDVPQLFVGDMNSNDLICASGDTLTDMQFVDQTNMW